MLIGLDGMCHLNDSFVFAIGPSSFISQVMGEVRTLSVLWGSH